MINNLFVYTRNGQNVGIAWPQILGTLAQEPDTLTIIGSFCLVTLSGAGVASLGRTILDREISELREGGKTEGILIDKITLDHSLQKLPASGR